MIQIAWDVEKDFQPGADAAQSMPGLLADLIKNKYGHDGEPEPGVELTISYPELTTQDALDRARDNVDATLRQLQCEVFADITCDGAVVVMIKVAFEAKVARGHHYLPPKANHAMQFVLPKLASVTV